MFVAGACGFSLRTAVKTWGSARASLRSLRKQVDRHLSSQASTRGDGRHEPVSDQLTIPLGRSVHSLEQEVELLVDEIFQDENLVLTEAAILELFAHHAAMKSDLNTVRRGLLRVPPLSGVVAALLISASMGISQSSATWGVGCLGIGIFTSILCQWIISRGHRLATEFRKMIEVIQRTSRTAMTGT